MTRQAKVAVGIPARMSSTRFPGKPLKLIQGVPMLEHVYHRCALADCVDEVFVAACDPEVEEAVKGWGGQVVMTSPEIARPALRVAEACQSLNYHDDDIVVVVQGDEPLVHPEMIDLAVAPLLSDPDLFCVNLVGELSQDQWTDPNEIKVVADLQGNAIYMSRSPIPSLIHPEMTDMVFSSVGRRQVCVFPFRKRSLIEFNQLSPTPMEEAESIEMLRAIESGRTVRLVDSKYQTRSVDTEADLVEVERIMADDPVLALYTGRQ